MMALYKKEDVVQARGAAPHPDGCAGLQVCCTRAIAVAIVQVDSADVDARLPPGVPKDRLQWGFTLCDVGPLQHRLLLPCQP